MMWVLFQVLIRIIVLQTLAVPVWGSHVIGGPIADVPAKLELDSKIGGSLADSGSKAKRFHTEDVNDRFDAFQESFNEGITIFDDDSRNYIDVKAVATDIYMDSNEKAKFNPAPNFRAAHKLSRKELFGNAAEGSGPFSNGKLSTSEPVGDGLVTIEPPVDVDLEPTLTEFASEDLTPAVLSQICGSREFQPTLENWWISGADQWLRNYTVNNKNTSAFENFGLVGSITRQYLGVQDFGYEIDPKGGFRQGTCLADCLEVVEKIEDLEEAKRVFFVLAGVVGLVERIGTVYNAVRVVPQGVAGLVKTMPTNAGLDATTNQISNILFDSIDSVLFAASPWIPTGKIYQDGYQSLRAAKHHYDVAVQVFSLAAKGADPYKWDKAFDSAYGMSIAEIDFAPKGYAEGTVPIPDGMGEGTWYSKAVLRTRRALEDARTLVVELESGNLTEARDEGFELFKELFAYNQESPSRKLSQDSGVSAESDLKDAARRARAMLADVLTRLLRGDTSSDDGTTNLSKLIRYGNYLPSGPAESISNFKKANIAEIITRDIFMELFDNSIRQTLVYISCTEDKQHRADPRKDLAGANVDTCNRDNSGPQDLKACFENMVCYLYEWNERPMSHMSRNRAPKGHENWDEEPWSIDAQDIIISSVAHSLQNGPSTGNTTEEANFYYDTITLDTLRDARSARHFKIPVCFSAHNWNTQLNGWNTFCDTSKHCTAKNLPCQCGASGKDTQAVWREIGLLSSPRYNFYSATLCPRQIQKKIADPLERYVAYCNLGIKRWGSGSRVDGPRRYQGRDKYCDVITKAVEIQPNGLVGEVDPETKFTFLCQIQKGGRGCSMYKETFASMWDATRENIGMAARRV